MCTRLTFENAPSFTICRDDGKYLVLNVENDSRIEFTNVETDQGGDTDWLWYYKVAKNTSCMKIPKTFDLEKPCPGHAVDRALSLGCSNSAWP